MRQDGWEQEYSEVVRKAYKKEWEWGEHDCCAFACSIIECVTGKDVLQEFKDEAGDYSTSKEAYRAMRNWAGSVLDVARKMCKRYEWHQIPIEKAQRGDVVCAKSDHGLTMGSIVNNDIAVASKPKGIVFIPKEQAVECWRVN